MSALDVAPHAERTVLAVETSCDETCAAIVRGATVLSNVVASQFDLHGRFGGVVPEIASRKHLEAVDAVIAEAIERAGVEPDAVAVTQGPGLVGALLVGLANAKARAYAAGLPLVPVDHLHGHVASTFLSGADIEFPFLCLLVSGGHSLLLDVDESLGLTLLGTTRDDAAGEAFDKGARLLGLGMPGGPAIEQLADGGDASSFPITPAMVHHDTCDTSFAGIKTALAMVVRSGVAATEQGRKDLAASLQLAIVDTLVASVRKAIAANPQRWSSCAVVGGVAANTLLRERMHELATKEDLEMVTVPMQFCPDNAAMIGVAAAWCPEVSAAQARIVDAYATSPLFRGERLVPRLPL